MDPPSDPARRPVGADPDRARRPVDPDPAGRGGLSIEETRATKAHALLEGRELSLSNLSKVLYPRASFSKRHVIDYYAAIAPAQPSAIGSEKPPQWLSAGAAVIQADV